MRICCSLFPFCLLNDFRVNATLGPGRKGIMTRSCKFCNSYLIAVSHNLVKIVLNCSVFVIHRQHKCIFWSFLGLVQVVLSDFITKNNRYMRICCSLFPFCLLNDFRVNATLGPGRKGIMTRSCKFCNSYLIAVSHNLVEIVLNCSVFVIHRQHKCFLGLGPSGFKRFYYQK